jgi:hypothetical protein
VSVNCGSFRPGLQGRLGGGNGLKSARLEGRLVVLAAQFDIPAQRTHHLYKRTHLLLRFGNDLPAAIDSLDSERRDAVDLPLYPPEGLPKSVTKT